MANSSPRSLLLLAALASACGGGHAGHGHDAGAEFVTCVGESRADVYTPGLEKAGRLGAARVRLLESDPAPPIRGDNRWTVEIVATAGAPLDGLVISVTPFMPDHQHGTPVKAVVTAAGTPGRYHLSPVNLFMAGLWQITIDLRNSTGLRDQAVFAFCVPS
jgi:hypothetical protein